MLPSPEYLRIIDELLECRDDESLHRVKQRLQEFFDREGRRTTKRSFIERYIGIESCLHLHCICQCPFINNATWQFCLVVQSVVNSEGATVCKFNPVSTSDTVESQVQMTVFVDVREFSQQPQMSRNVPLGRVIPSVVRLYRLDECKSRWGNARKNPGEIFLTERSPLAGPDPCPEGELAVFEPFGVDLGDSRIQLDEIEYKVVKSRPDLINDLTGQNGDFGRRSLPNIEIFLAIRLRDDLIRLTSGVSGVGKFDRLDIRADNCIFGR